jgi:hypothetical protein
MSKHKLEYLVILLAATTILAGCVKQTTTVSNQTNVASDSANKVNQFLANQGITLPAGALRANLVDVSSSGGTGVVTKEVQSNKTTYSVIADLPDPVGGHYEAWLQQGNSANVDLGQLVAEKGGYIVEKMTTEDWSAYVNVVISKESGKTATPTQIILKGQFGQ